MKRGSTRPANILVQPIIPKKYYLNARLVKTREKMFKYFRYFRFSVISRNSTDSILTVLKTRNYKISKTFKF